MNATIEDIMTRRSVREFDSRAIGKEDIETLLEAGLSAPSAWGDQSRYIAVFEDKGVRSKISTVLPWNKFVEKAPVTILVLGNPEVCHQKEYWTVDCAALTENILIAARALGLGTVWCGISPVEGNMAAIRSILDIPAPLIPFSAIAVGYPAEANAFHRKKTAGSGSFVEWNPDWKKKDAE